MRTYSKRHAPTAFDSAANYVSFDSDGEARLADWLVLLGRNRESDCLVESNFYVALKRLGGESETVEVHRFGHWACGWYELILVHPSRSAEALAIEEYLDDYPILDEDDHSEREQKAADLTWKNCYSNAGRVEYIREHREQFEFHTFADMLGCVRGNYFGGYASEMAY